MGSGSHLCFHLTLRPSKAVLSTDSQSGVEISAQELGSKETKPAIHSFPNVLLWIKGSE